jgi:hypothetical protein
MKQLKRMKTRKISEALVPVKVNSKTTIMVPAGTDPQAAIDRFNGRIASDQEFYTNRQRMCGAERLKSKKELI